MSARRESVVAALVSPDLASIIDLVVWVEVDAEHSSDSEPAAMAASHVGRVRLHRDGRHEVLEGLDPIASEDPMAFLPYDRECSSPCPNTSRDNSYPYAASRILSLFADPTRNPDLAVVHKHPNFLPDHGGPVGCPACPDLTPAPCPPVLSREGCAAGGRARGRPGGGWGLSCGQAGAKRQGR